MSKPEKLTLALVEKLRWWAARGDTTDLELAALFSVPLSWVKYSRTALPADLSQLSAEERVALSERYLAAVERSREYIAYELGGEVPLPSLYDGVVARQVCTEEQFATSPLVVLRGGRMGDGNRRILPKCPSDQLGGNGIWWAGLIHGDRGSFV